MDRTNHTKTPERPPTIEAPFGAQAEGRVTDTPSKICTVLVVEDDDDVAGLIADLLRDRGHLVYAAPDARGALERLGAIGVDVILLDLSLPDMSGTEFLEHVPQLATTRVVILSGSEDATSVAELRKLSVLRKPFGADELVSVVEADVQRLSDSGVEVR